MAVCTADMINLCQSLGYMASQTGVSFYSLIFIMFHHVWCITVIMALGTAQGMGFTLLSCTMTLPAGYCLVIVLLLFMAFTAIAAMKLFDFVMAELIGPHILTMAVFTGYSRARTIQRMMTDSTGVSHHYMIAMIKKNWSTGTLEIFSVSTSWSFRTEIGEKKCCGCNNRNYR
ncbi:MAG: hypothetical protein V2I36_04310 [Desulfopila sp.]|nr:hypothetical protein [Desulfopila sp.]